jgi:transposase-like protein
MDRNYRGRDANNAVLAAVDYRAHESAQDWRDLLLDLKRRGFDVRPKLAIADGALGFWNAAGEVWPTTREQRCWAHKTANVLAKLPKSQQPKAKRALSECESEQAHCLRVAQRCRGGGPRSRTSLQRGFGRS